MGTRRPPQKTMHFCYKHKKRVHPVKVHSDGHVDMQCDKGCKLTLITVPSKRIR